MIDHALLIWTGGSTPLLCLEGVPDLPVAPQDEAGLTKTFQTGFAHPQWWCVQGACAVPSFCSQLFTSDSWGNLVFLHLCPEFASTAHTDTYSSSFTVSLYFCSLRRGVSRCRHNSTVAEGPGPRPVSLREEVEVQSVRAQ